MEYELEKNDSEYGKIHEYFHASCSVVNIAVLTWTSCAKSDGHKCTCVFVYDSMKRNANNCIMSMYIDVHTSHMDRFENLFEQNGEEHMENNKKG